MAMKHLLVHVDSSERSRERLELAVELATRFGARLAGLFAEGTSIGGSAVARRSPQNMARARAAARSLFEAMTLQSGLATDWWEVEQGELAQVVTWTIVCCRYVDLAIFGQHDPGRENSLPAGFVEQVLLESGRPVLVVPYAGHHPRIGRRVIVVWTGSREAARALNDAIPILGKAEAVTLLSLQEAPGPGSSLPAAGPDVIVHLRSHGIEAMYEKILVNGDDVPVVDTVLNRAADCVADLIVLGGHGNSGFPYLQLSATTRDVLRTMTVPVLLSR